MKEKQKGNRIPYHPIKQNPPTFFSSIEATFSFFSFSFKNPKQNIQNRPCFLGNRTRIPKVIKFPNFILHIQNPQCNKQKPRKCNSFFSPFSHKPIRFPKKSHWPECVDSLEDRFVRITRKSPASPSKRQIRTAALLGLNLPSYSTEVADSAKPTWETTLPAASSMRRSSRSS